MHQGQLKASKSAHICTKKIKAVHCNSLRKEPSSVVPGSSFIESPNEILKILTNTAIDGVPQIFVVRGEDVMMCPCVRLLWP